MRKVVFKTWVKAQFDGEGQIPNTGCPSKDFTERGVFHAWGITCKEVDGTNICYSVALVELQNGTIKEVLPSMIKFTSPIK